MCDFKGVYNGKISLGSTCQAIKITQATFSRCSSTTAGGALNMDKAIPFYMTDVNFMDCTTSKYGGGAFVIASAVNIQYGCFCRCSGSSKAPSGEKNFVFAGRFGTKKSGQSLTARELTVYYCPGVYCSSGDLTISLNSDVSTLSFLNMTNNQPRVEVLGTNGGVGSAAPRYLTLAENTPGELIDNYLTGSPVYEYCNLYNNNKYHTSTAALVNGVNAMTLRNSVVAGNTASKLGTPKVTFTNVYFYGNSVSTNEYRTGTLKITYFKDGECKYIPPPTPTPPPTKTPSRSPTRSYSYKYTVNFVQILSLKILVILAFILNK